MQFFNVWCQRWILPWVCGWQGAPRTSTGGKGVGRLSSQATLVLLQSIRDGLSLLTWSKDSFAFAESYDESAGRYRGLRCGQMVAISEDTLAGLLVKSEIAQKQADAETKITPPPPPPSPPPPGEKIRPKRFHGAVALDATRVGRDAGRIADEVIAHLSGLVGSSVKVTLEIEADVSAGMPENVVRTVTENSRTLKFSSYGFERE